jgi:hypothetical protein
MNTLLTTFTWMIIKHILSLNRTGLGSLKVQDPEKVMSVPETSVSFTPDIHRNSRKELEKSQSQGPKM